ncbi:MAG: hypothetical protein LBP76_09495 [Treponema sp.]|jgi:hypothetical protein|nr:hypothetical protein [Treponema sp.]
MNKQYALTVRDTPHLLGHVLGFTKLLPIHSKWIKNTWDSPGSHALMAFRGSYKTTAVVVIGIIRYLLFFPNARIFLIRKTFAEAAKYVRVISLCFNKPELRALFYEMHGILPEKIVDNTGELTFNFKASGTAEANITAYGIGTAITGGHADVIIADDIITLEDRTSRAERESVKEHIRELSANIIDPGKLTIWLGTKWAQGDGWDVIERFTKIEKYPIEKYNFLPEEEIEEKRRRLTPFLFAVNYSLELMSDESLMFQEPRYGHFDVETWRTAPVIAHVDAAYGGEDTCAMTIMGGNSAVGFLHEGHIQGWYDFIKTQYQKFHCREILLETNSDKGYVAKELRALGLNTRAYSEHDNKAIKISTHLYGAWGDLIWDERTDPNYMNQILDYRPGSGSHDDAPDSAASLLRERGSKKMISDREAIAWSVDE